MLHIDLELILKYPLISPRILEGKKQYAGKVLCGNCDINLEIFEENNVENFKLKTTFDEVTDDKIANVTCSSIVEFIDKIVTILKEKNESTQQNSTHIYKRILQEYSEFTEFFLAIKKSQLSTDLTKITITIIDDGGRDHVLEISADVNRTKDIFAPVNLNLPDKLTIFATYFSSLAEIYSKFIAAIESLQPFFDVMDDLDCNYCILDPHQPTKRDCYRRIWLDQNLSMMVVVDPLNAKGRPELKFLGPERIVDGYLERISENLEDWNGNTQMSQGLLSILGLATFPSKPRSENVMLIDTGECSICFSLRVNDKLPEVICENKCCENVYHVNCLYEWLTSVNSKRIFNQIHGQCPNCEKKITCPLPEADTA